ncbi:MAG: Eco57I restriction-modification methylase domain-containing protein, partial [Deltaproteobacteria bacterium]|nr:Eco57I restriction-modification methylase domain-containing protein [Deltaproteobacteria bacterium]
MGTQNRRFSSIGAVNPIEDYRLQLQIKLDALKSMEERRKLGQFATPTSLAKEIVAFGLKQLSAPNNITFFDPAFGTGAFYSALLQEGVFNNIAKATVVEIDPLFANAAKNIWSKYNINIINDDFTNINPDGLYNFVICNPPYVRHHLIEPKNKENIKIKTIIKSGVELSGLSGLYCHFLLQSIPWMDDGAVAGWLIPSEFMDVNYGKAVKNFLLSEVELFRVHRFNPEDGQFKDALVSSAVIWFRKKKPDNQVVTFSFGGTLTNPRESKEISVSSLRMENKWTRFPCQPQRQLKFLPKLKDYFDVKRGIATGCNDFFILNESKIVELDLPIKFFRPILPSARFVKVTEVESDKNG